MGAARQALAALDHRYPVAQTQVADVVLYTLWAAGHRFFVAVADATAEVLMLEVATFTDEVTADTLTLADDATDDAFDVAEETTDDTCEVTDDATADLAETADEATELTTLAVLVVAEVEETLLELARVEDVAVLTA